MSEPSPQPASKAVETLRFLKGQLSSGAATVVDWGVITILVHLNVYYVYAVMLGAVAGAATDFSIKKWWVFHTAMRHGNVEAIRYVLVSGTSALLNGLFVYICVDGLKMSKPVGVVVTSFFVGIVWNYPLHRLYVFSSTAPAARSEQS